MARAQRRKDESHRADEIFAFEIFKFGQLSNERVDQVTSRSSSNLWGETLLTSSLHYC